MNDIKPDDGGPVGPIQKQILPDGSLIYTSEGMTLRDIFAGQALAGIFARHSDRIEELHFSLKKEETLHDVANFSYQIADAMIAARKEAK